MEASRLNNLVFFNPYRPADDLRRNYGMVCQLDTSAVAKYQMLARRTAGLVGNLGMACPAVETACAVLWGGAWAGLSP